MLKRLRASDIPRHPQWTHQKQQYRSQFLELAIGTQARRTRGPNRCISLTNQRERIVVECNEYGQPIGRNERLLSSYLGVIARDGQKAPLNYSDWRRMPAERTTDLWQAIQARSRRNSRNREAQTMSHTAGTKSFARICDEARARDPNGQVLDRMEVFRITHTCRDGQLVDRASEDVMRQLNERLSQLPESSQSRTTRDDIFTQVMGVDGRGWVRTFGLGVTSSDIYGPRASIAEARAAAAEARAAAVESARIAEVERAQRIAMQEEVVQMRTQLNQLMTWMQSFTGSGPSSSSSVPISGAATNDIQHDGPV